MSEKYKFWNKEKAYFITLTVVGWIDVFTRKNHKLIITDCLSYCQKEKGLSIFAFCLMPSHLHLIVRADGRYTLSEILRDFKKFTSKAIINQIINETESRRKWMLEYFWRSNTEDSKKGTFKFWQEGNHPEEISSNKFFDEKLEYIHNNPVNELIVEDPEDYLFSSARNYADLRNYLDIIIESRKQLTY